MPKKNAKKIKQTRKQKKKSELKKKVRRVIQKKYSDSDDILYQAEREYYSSSSSEEDSVKNKKKKTRYESSSDSSSGDSSDDRRKRKYREESSDDRRKYREESSDDRRKYREESSDDRRKYREESSDDRRKYREESSDDRRKYREESSDDRRKYREESVDERHREETSDDRRKRKQVEESVDERHREETSDDRRKRKQVEESVDERHREETSDDRRKRKQVEESVDERHREEKVDDRRKRKQVEESVDERHREETVEEDKKEEVVEEFVDERHREEDSKEETVEDSKYSGTLQEEQLTRTESAEIKPQETAMSEPLPEVIDSYVENLSNPILVANSIDKQKPDFDEKLLQSKFQYMYDNEEDEIPTEHFSSKKIEEFILSKGFMILEYFLVHDLCTFILVQLPAICETMMVYINRKKFPIVVADSSYQKTALEKLRIEKCEDDTNDYENMTLSGFDLNHTLDTIKETNQQQKSLAYYIYRQISRMMYVTKNIEIKPCILLNGIFGFYEIYHMPERKLAKEFYPVISLETLFSKTFLLENNIPVFYKRFYGIMNQSNRNKMEYLESSISSILKKMETLRKEMADLQKKDTDKQRVKSIVERLDKRVVEIGEEKKSILEEVQDRVTQSYQIKNLDDQTNKIDLRKAECNALYSEIKREYDQNVFHHELMFHELYYKIRDMESLLSYLN
jgi:hypothetical protein